MKIEGFQKRTTATALNGLVGDATHRPYLGCSQIGHECMRYLWFSFRWCYQDNISARLKRLFLRGHREEPEIIKELNQIGIRCYDDQAECNFVDGHMSGHCDGKAMGVVEAPTVEHLLEFKTASDKKFKEMVKNRVRKANPVYYAQMQVYMLGLGLTWAMFIMVNKNDDTYYIERVEFNKTEADEYILKGLYIIKSEEPMAIAKPCGPTWYKCKWCAAKGICMDGEPMEVNCRTCVHSVVGKEGSWGCRLHGMVIATGQQRIGCGKYKSIEYGI